MSIVLTRQVQHDEALMRLSNALMPFAFQISLGATLLRNLIQLLRFFFFHPRRDKCACACSTVYASQARINSQKKKKEASLRAAEVLSQTKLLVDSVRKRVYQKKKKKSGKTRSYMVTELCATTAIFYSSTFKYSFRRGNLKKRKQTHTHTHKMYQNDMEQKKRCTVSFRDNRAHRFST